MWVWCCLCGCECECGTNAQRDLCFNTRIESAFMESFGNLWPPFPHRNLHSNGIDDLLLFLGSNPDEVCLEKEWSGEEEGVGRWKGVGRR